MGCRQQAAQAGGGRRVQECRLLGSESSLSADGRAWPNKPRVVNPESAELKNGYGQIEANTLACRRMQTVASFLQA